MVLGQSMGGRYLARIIYSIFAINLCCHIRTLSVFCLMIMFAVLMLTRSLQIWTIRKGVSNRMS
jgi:hypothetical protein